jgi:hypothetical protein
MNNDGKKRSEESNLKSNQGTQKTDLILKDLQDAHLHAPLSALDTPLKRG